MANTLQDYKDFLKSIGLSMDSKVKELAVKLYDSSILDVERQNRLETCINQYSCIDQYMIDLSNEIKSMFYQEGQLFLLDLETKNAQTAQQIINTNILSGKGISVKDYIDLIDNDKNNAEFNLKLLAEFYSIIIFRESLKRELKNFDDSNTIKLRWRGESKHLKDLIYKLIEKEWLHPIEALTLKSTVDAIFNCFDITESRKKNKSDLKGTLYQNFKSHLDDKSNVKRKMKIDELFGGILPNPKQTKVK